MAEVSKIIMSDNASRSLPRSPTSISPKSSRRGSLRSSDHEIAHNFRPPSPPVRLTRKRAASIHIESTNHPRIEDLALNSATIKAPSETREQVCLCQPDPKIPRPRNAFILYRQHYQAQVVAQNPGLANPEISKIIGEQWREQPAEVKNDWKRLAEEEKQRHQRQYPDYRYQPRRAGKTVGGRPISSSTSEDPIRCPKCHGRYISTPSTPLTPFTSAFQPRATERLLPPFTPTPPEREMESERARYAQAPMQAPRSAPPHQTFRRPQYNQPGSSAGPVLLRDREENVEMIQSPRQKRHRPNEATNAPYPSPSWSAESQRPSRPLVYGEDRRGPLPSPSALVYHHNGGMMEPPPRPQQMNHHYNPQTPIRSNNFDSSLTLPPLQTQVSDLNVHGSNQRQLPSQRLENYARSVEAMVMTIPFINKIKVLSKISPALAQPGPSSPAQEVRGTVIAVEGADERIVREVGRFIEEYLDKEREFLVRSWTELSNPRLSESSIDADMGGMDNRSNHSNGQAKSQDLYQTYLSTILAWHDKSSEITNFITTAPTAASTSIQRGESDTKSSTPTLSSLPPHKSGTNRPVSPSTASTNSPNRSRTSVSPLTNTPPSSITQPTHKHPIALLPAGFSLTTSDKFASLIPINDAYAPVDHWQWMATLWRGIIGPDLTVYVKSVSNDRDDREELQRNGAVEVRTDCRGIVVRVERKEGLGLGIGMGAGMEMHTGVEEKVLRRVGFEVLEFVRGLGSGIDDSGRFGRP